MTFQYSSIPLSMINFQGPCRFEHLIRKLPHSVEMKIDLLIPRTLAKCQSIIFRVKIRPMIFLLRLPPVLGALIAVLISLAFTGALFIIAHIFFRDSRPNEFKNIAQQMALRIGTMHALVVAPVYHVTIRTRILYSQWSCHGASSAYCVNIVK